MQRLIMLNRSDKYKYKIARFREDIPKPKKNEVVMVPEDNRLLEIPPYIASKKLPSWWNDLPKNKSSLRKCQGTYDYVSFGFIIPLWTDLVIRPDMSGKDFEGKTTPIYNYKGVNPYFELSGFSAESASGCPMENIKKIPTGRYIKIVSPWRYKTSKGVSLMALPILHEPNENYEVVPGMIHTDFYNQIHIVLNIKTDKEFTIPAGTPIQHMVPVYRGRNTKNIVWGNESMYPYVANSGLGLGALVQTDRNLYYRRKQREIDAEIEKESKKWNFLKR